MDLEDQFLHFLPRKPSEPAWGASLLKTIAKGRETYWQQLQRSAKLGVAKAPQLRKGTAKRNNKQMPKIGGRDSLRVYGTSEHWGTNTSSQKPKYPGCYICHPPQGQMSLSTKIRGTGVFGLLRTCTILPGSKVGHPQVLMCRGLSGH